MNKGLTSKRWELTSQQKLMIFILSMSLYGISNMITELIPEFKFGPIELKVEYFIFIPLLFAILFNPLYAALGACVGEVIFGELLLGQFGGLGELEKFIEFALAIFIAGMLVKDPSNKRQLAIAAYVAIGIDQLLGTIVDIGKVYFGIEEFEAVSGLPESILVIEGVAFLNAMVISGTLFALLPTLYLVPRLYGKVEPLLGMKPRDGRAATSLTDFVGPRLLLIAILLFVFAGAAEFLAESDINFIDWESEFIAEMGNGAIWISMSVAAVIFIITIVWAVNRRASKRKGEAA
ncbi:cell division protein FtsQ [Paenibacillus sp. FSL H8-0548]|uniref:cell division protein FtsQ n=1 Tax=Paenibacillus sp. FSL H8-0548 TaxID=1920422 RepID=UPI00096FD663|nr:cell division protein FtsQ [Paenibacillus sp. FSL H8-0548]OMF27205.1 cell division protein FtsQ [Paenibacillus sp. FSL H8-0548]